MTGAAATQRPVEYPMDHTASHQPASYFSRVLAMLIDTTIFVAGTKAVQFIMYRYLGVNKSILILGFVFYMVAFYFYNIDQTHRNNQTLGKKLIGIKVINIDGSSKLGLGQCFLREFVGRFLSALIFFIGYLLPLFNDKKQALHDMIAKTRVVKV